jgi:hypothetical protein
MGVIIVEKNRIYGHNRRQVVASFRLRLSMHSATESCHPDASNTAAATDL